MKKYPKRLFKLAYNAMERDSLSDEERLSERGDKAMDNLFAHTMTKSDLEWWAIREREWIFLTQMEGSQGKRVDLA